MPVYLVLDIALDNAERYREYVRRVAPEVAAFGGRYRVRGGSVQCLEGDWKPERLVIIEFTDRARALSFLDSPGYRAIRPIRLAAARSRVILVDGVDEPQEA